MLGMFEKGRELALRARSDSAIGIAQQNECGLIWSLELSSGQTQRLLIAWAMLQQPDVLLLDEPTAGVDAGFEDTIYSVIRRVQSERGTTVLLISHDLSVVYRYAQRVLCLNTTVVCQGSPIEALNPEALAVLYGAAGYYRHDPDVRH
jgi:zinc transport system ATP-binding protein